MEEEKTFYENSQSNFVTVLAWIAIIISGFVTLIMIMQYILFNSFENFMAMPYADVSGGGHMPDHFGSMFGLMKLIAIFIFTVSAGSLISAIGLLYRKNWARIVFIVMISFCIIFVVIGYLAQVSIFFIVPGLTAAGFPEFNQMIIVMLLFSSLFNIGLVVLFGWLIKKLGSKPVRVEFGVEISDDNIKY